MSLNERFDWVALGLTMAAIVVGAFVVLTCQPAMAACDTQPVIESFPGRPITNSFVFTEPSGDCEGNALGLEVMGKRNDLLDCTVKAYRVQSDGTRRTIAQWTIPASSPSGAGRHELWLPITTTQWVELQIRCRNLLGLAPMAIQHRKYTAPGAPADAPPVP